MDSVEKAFMHTETVLKVKAFNQRPFSFSGGWKCRFT